MPSFSKIEMEIYFSIPPRFLADPSSSIYTQLTHYLFKYSKSVQGFPLSFQLQGVTPWGKINEDGSVYVNTLVEFCILKLSVGDNVEIHEGMLIDVLPCSVDGNESFTGSFRFTSIERGSKIIGTLVTEPEF